MTVYKAFNESLKCSQKYSLGYVKSFSHIVDEEIETRTGYTTRSKSYLLKMVGLNLEIQMSEPQILVKWSKKEHPMC